MKVLAFTEYLYHIGVLRQVCHDSQLYLTIVGREEQTARFWYKGFANLLAIFTTDRNILQVGIAAGETTRSRDGLVERSMDMPCFGIDKFRQTVDIGA